MASNDIGDWYRNIPQISRYWFTGSIILPLIGKIGLVSPMSMLLDFNLLVYSFQIWRPITALFYYPIMPQTGFQYLLNLYFLYSYSTRLESGVFDGRPADYLFMLLFNWVLLVIIGLLAEIRLLMNLLILSVLYIWCQFNKDQIVQFWFGTQFKAMYLPWILVAFNMILGHGGWQELLGIFVGHLYFFLMYKYPQDFGGRQFLQTPSFLYSFFPNRRGGVAGFGTAPTARRRQEAAGDEQRHSWGRGHQLGND
jgi:derlin-1